MNIALKRILGSGLMILSTGCESVVIGLNDSSQRRAPAGLGDVRRMTDDAGKVFIGFPVLGVFGVGLGGIQIS
jgi:hypothetical protein